MMNEALWTEPSLSYTIIYCGTLFPLLNIHNFLTLYWSVQGLYMFKLRQCTSDSSVNHLSKLCRSSIGNSSIFILTRQNAHFYRDIVYNTWSTGQLLINKKTNHSFHLEPGAKVADVNGKAPNDFTGLWIRTLLTIPPMQVCKNKTLPFKDK